MQNMRRKYNLLCVFIAYFLPAFACPVGQAEREKSTNNQFNINTGYLDL
jgi:hypothetical protein